MFTVPKISLFQFHKGTIKTLIDAQTAAAVAAFQFHKGTIKTEQALLAHTQNQYFNSIKVQLRRLFYSTGSVFILYFNSIKVQLRHNAGDERAASQNDFNSIKVQLRRC